MRGLPGAESHEVVGSPALVVVAQMRKGCSFLPRDRTVETM